VESAVNEKPVIDVAAAGLTPMFPVMAEVGTVEIPVFASIAKVPAAPRFTGNVVVLPRSVTLPASPDRAPSLMLAPSGEVPEPEAPHAAANERISK
jgi:hypothetical protein